MTEDIVVALWEMYGLKSNPFSTNPLLIRGGILPIDCFVGRKQEISTLELKFGSGGSRVLVIGDVGVGKTSFVNFVRYKAMNYGYFSPIREIAVLNNWSTYDFILNTLFAIYTTIIGESKQNLLPKSLLDKIKGLVEIGQNIFTGGGFSIAGFGAQWSKDQKTAYPIPYMALLNLIENVVNEIYSKTGKEIILHYNNLENLEEQNLKTLFNDLRDFMQTPNINFIFVGNLTVNNIIQNITRVSTIFSDTIKINELSLSEVKAIINIRLEKLKIPGMKLTKPFEDSALDILYKLYGGNIRSILNSLDAAITASANQLPFILKKDNLPSILYNVAETKFLGNITQKAKSILLEAVKYKEITNSELSRQTKTDKPNISKYIKELENAGCLFLRRKNGRDKYWSVNPNLKWLLLKDNTKF
jgi:hypothetical protein